ncbi:MAG: hypothetical protein LBG28_14975 [Tannerella sp.]|jgi:hypothetical protein|nr:hypothetical protein [Tannerella sp.]
MKRLKTYLLALFLSSLCLLFSGCEDDYSHLSSEEAIIGKWKLIKQGPDEEYIEPVDFDSWLEFCPDKTMQGATYYMDQEYLYLQDTRMWIYEYKFTNKKNTLTLKVIHEKESMLLNLIPGIVWGYYRVRIYRRVK